MWICTKLPPFHSHHAPTVDLDGLRTSTCTYSIASSYKHVTLDKGDAMGSGNGSLLQGHRIEVSAWLGSDGWFVSLYVITR
jgi:hypothetical protein